jgi:hypothetical protein
MILAVLDGLFTPLTVSTSTSSWTGMGYGIESVMTISECGS